MTPTHLVIPPRSLSGLRFRTKVRRLEDPSQRRLAWSSEVTVEVTEGVGFHQTVVTREPLQPDPGRPAWARRSGSTCTAVICVRGLYL